MKQLDLSRQWLSVLSTFFVHEKIVSSMQKNFRARDAFECSNVFLSAGNNPGVSRTILSTLNHCLLRLNNSRIRHFSLPCSVRILSTSKNQSYSENLVMNCLNYFETRKMTSQA